MRLLFQLVLCLHLLMPIAAQAQVPKDPLNYPLRQWMFVLGMALAGGLASWVLKVRAGEYAPHNLMALVGELTVAAFAGVITFLGCEYFSLGPFATPALVGIAGHMGGRAINMMERAIESRAKVVVPPERP